MRANAIRWLAAVVLVVVSAVSQAHHGGPIVSFTLGDGRHYDGERDNRVRPHGHGKMTMPNGSSYEGEYRHGLKHGQGIFTNSDGTRIEGEFRDGEPYGAMNLMTPDERHYVGEISGDGIPHGKGTLTFPDGTEYVGTWREGQLHGRTVITEPDGTRREIEFRDGEPVVN